MQRIQRKRTKGWRMPGNAVYVGRPTKWGNPFAVKDYGRAQALRLYAAYIEGLVYVGERDLSDLRGKDLACWCRPDEPCHADVLIDIVKAG